MRAITLFTSIVAARTGRTIQHRGDETRTRIVAAQLG
jgi:hypothetical protein